MQGLIEGDEPSLFPWVCDLADVAKAHVLAAEVPTAKGRYLISQENEVPDQEIIDVLKKRFPQFKIKDSDKNPGHKQFLSSQKVWRTGISLKLTMSMDRSMYI